MRALTPIPSDSPIEFSSPAHFCLALIALAANDLSYPSSGDVRWLEGAFPNLNPDADPFFFCPYALTGSGVVLKPWASAAYRYMGRMLVNKLPAHALAPEQWRENIASLCSDLLYADPAVHNMVQLMLDWYVDPAPGSPEMARRNALEARAAQAIEAKTLIYEPKKAAAAIALTASRS